VPSFLIALLLEAESDTGCLILDTGYWTEKDVYFISSESSIWEPAFVRLVGLLPLAAGWGLVDQRFSNFWFIDPNWYDNKIVLRFYEDKEDRKCWSKTG